MYVLIDEQSFSGIYFLLQLLMYSQTSDMSDKYKLLYKNRRKAGITLQELLISTVVIAILLAIILFLFSRTRELCYQAQCANNLRQFAHAFSLYSQDWNGCWPSPGGLVGDRSYWSQSGKGGLNRYIRQSGLESVWCCPRLDNWSGIYPARSYSMNSYLREPADIDYPSCVSILRGIKVDTVAKPSRTILLFEGIPRSGPYQNTAYSEDQVYYIYRCANWTWARGYPKKLSHTIDPDRPWHGKKNNYLYCDGHVVARPPGPKTSGTYSSYKEMYEWYVDKDYYEAVYKQTIWRFVPRE